MNTKELKDFDKELYDAIENELERQRTHIELIASENFVSKAVLEAQGSCLTNKHSEGFPHGYRRCRAHSCWVL